jgi:hypothetical protein
MVDRPMVVVGLGAMVDAHSAPFAALLKLF